MMVMAMTMTTSQHVNSISIVIYYYTQTLASLYVVFGNSFVCCTWHPLQRDKSSPEGFVVVVDVVVVVSGAVHRVWVCVFVGCAFHEGSSSAHT